MSIMNLKCVACGLWLVKVAIVTNFVCLYLEHYRVLDLCLLNQVSLYDHEVFQFLKLIDCLCMFIFHCYYLFNP